MPLGRKRYPTRDGIPVKPVGLDECFDVCPKNVNRTNKHHLAFNRSMYRTPTEKAYREAGCMAMQTCVCKHALLHATYEPPPKPSVQTMQDVVQGNLVPTEQVIFIRGLI